MFLTVNNFFLCVFKNTNQKNIRASIVLKLNQSRNMKKTFILGVFFKNQKRTFFGVQKGTF